MLQRVLSIATALLSLLVLPGCFSSCLEAGTPVETPQGPRPIEDLRPGDAVWAWDLARGRPVARKITAVSVHLNWRVPTMQTSGGRHLGVTSNHPIYQADLGRFVPAGDLPADAKLLTWTTAGTVAGTHLQAYETTPDSWLPSRVYDLTLAGPERCFFAGGVLVHNKEPPISPFRGHTVEPSPGDLTTALDQPPALLVFSTDATLDAGLLVSRVGLVTWPDLSPVAATASLETLAPTVPAGPNAKVKLQPDKALAAGWYAVVVAPLPDEWRLSDAGGSPLPWHELADGRRAVRFRPDSHPIVREIQIADKKQGEAVIYADLSEAVTPVQPPFVVQQDGKDIGCTELGSTAKHLGVRCPLWDFSRPADIALQPGMTGKGGTPLGVLAGPAPAAWTLTVSKRGNAGGYVFTP